MLFGTLSVNFICRECFLVFLGNTHASYRKRDGAVAFSGTGK